MLHTDSFLSVQFIWRIWSQVGGRQLVTLTVGSLRAQSPADSAKPSVTF